MAVVISSAALIVSAAQFYYGQGILHKSSALTVFVSSYHISTEDVVEHGELLKFRVRISVSMALVNSGTAPTALLSVYHAVPYSLESDCRSVEAEPGYLIGANNFYSPGFYALAYPIAAQSIAPGAIVIVDGKLDIAQAVRSKVDREKMRRVCLLFVGVDSKGEVFMAAFEAAQMRLGGYRPAEKVRLDIVPRRQQ